MKIVCLIILVLSTSFVRGIDENEAWCCTAPLRMIGTNKYNLNGAFFAWEHRAANRYNITNWAHIAAFLKGIDRNGYYLEGQIIRIDGTNRAYTKDTTKIFLRNPPVWEFTSWQQITNRLAEIPPQVARLHAIENQHGSTTFRHANGVIEYIPTDRLLYPNAKSQREALEQEKDLLKARLEQLPQCANNYRVDCFAFDLKTNWNGYQIFDYGRVAIH